MEVGVRQHTLEGVVPGFAGRVRAGEGYKLHQYAAWQVRGRQAAARADGWLLRRRRAGLCAPGCGRAG